VNLKINPLSIQIVTIFVAGALIVWVTLLTNNTTHQRSDRSLDSAHAAYQAAQIDAQRHAIGAVFERLGNGQQLDVLSAVSAYEQTQQMVTNSRTLEELMPGQRTTIIRTLSEGSLSELRNYFRTGSAADRERAEVAFSTLDASVEALQEEMNALSLREQDALKTASGRSLAIIIITVVTSTAIIGALSLIVGRRLHQSLANARSERDELAEVTRNIRKRNEQFNALYQVVNEVTDSLSMRYVVNTTVTEAAKLVNADYVRLRQLDGESLVVAGSWTRDDSIQVQASSLPLGVGISGRAAKRGKTMRIDTDAEASMAEGERVPGAQSGLVVPLIVGARVLGTISCWSMSPSNFDVDDERVLEMMAAQVASAVAAADLHQTSELKAAHDALTGLPNRRMLLENTPEMQKMLKAGASLAVVMLDIDHFKRFNDDFGHKVGDVTLQKVAEVMRGALRDTDELYRYGGEEFLLVLQNVGETEAFKLTERLRKAVERAPLTGESLEPVGPVTVSAGLALGPQHGGDFDELVKIADDALYQSKEKGRNRVTIAHQVGPELEPVAA
jgi:diguanylate cyclase (GGDEF)-like protein